MIDMLEHLITNVGPKKKMDKELRNESTDLTTSEKAAPRGIKQTSSTRLD